MSDFVPRRGLRSGHAMTLYSWGRPRRFPGLPSPTPRYFAVDADTSVLAHCYWQRDPPGHPALVALHGLEGSSGAHYMRGLANKAFARGFNVVLLNQRNCGGTEHLGPGLYHSGLTADAAHVLGELASADGIAAIVVAGYSLGGNLALKLAGDFGETPPDVLKGVCAVSPIIEISPCVRALERRSNFAYQWNFVKGLKRRMRRKSGHYPGRFPLDRIRRVRSVREFDELVTAPHFGFLSAEDYYHRASAMRVVDRIRVPALILAAADDPFVPAELFADPRLETNPHITTVVTRHGGHCGFVAASGRSNTDEDGYWAEATVIEFACRVVPPTD